MEQDFGTLNQGFQFLINLSPITWINRSIFLMIYDQKNELIWLISGLMVSIGLIFTVLAIFSISITQGIAAFLFLLIVSNLYGIFITLISKTDLMAGVLSTSIAILFAILGGTFVSVSNMPNSLQIISSISPMRWLMEML